MDIHMSCTSLFVSWCFEPSQPQRITLGLNTNFSLSPSHSFHKSWYHKSFSQTTAQILPTFFERKTRKTITHVLEPIYTRWALNSTWKPASKAHWFVWIISCNFSVKSAGWKQYTMHWTSYRGSNLFKLISSPKECVILPFWYCSPPPPPFFSSCTHIGLQHMSCT